MNKTGRLVCPILEIEDTFDFESYLAIIDVENFFDSFVSSLFMAVLKKVGFSSSYLEWSEVVLKNHQSNVGNTGIASLYFKVRKGKHERETILAYLFYFCFRNFVLHDK